ncbi:MAG: family 20 glycosylhydrolase [Planctomycetes bacterium]|nr:family 20 glycosylhydrolase [Planctomycetota bacterium]
MADAPARAPMEIRGIMLDSARLMEKHAFYFDLLEPLGRWGINTLWWHFCDDQGFGVALEGHPEIVTPYAFSKEEVRRFIRAAAEAGIDVVPEIETLGHASYITRLPQYAHLADGDPMHFNAACPSQGQTLELMRDILVETAELFDSPYLHAGLDEVNFGGCDRCAKRGRGKPDWWVYAEHVKAIHDVIAGAGKRMIMWADHVEKAPAMLDVLPKDIVMAHWQYWKVEREPIDRSLAAGFEVVGAPAMCWFGDMIVPRAANLDVVDDMAAAAVERAGRGMRGVVNTWWVPGRVVRDACLPAVKYTADVLNAGGGVDRVESAAGYLRDQFDLDCLPAARAIVRLSERALHMNEVQSLCLETTVDRFDAIALARGEGFAQRVADVGQAAEALAEGRAQVRRNAEAYEALVAAARTAAACLNNGPRMLAVYDACLAAQRARNRGAAAEAAAAALSPAVEALEAIAAELDEATDLVARQWDRTRHGDDPNKHLDDVDRPCGRDKLLGRLARGRAAVRRTLEAFREGVSTVAAGGELPRWG